MQTHRLRTIFDRHKGFQVRKFSGYFEVYERHFGRYVGKPVTMFEIGCGKGGSLQIWKRWLGQKANIIGIDIRPECRAFEEDRISVRIGGQQDAAFLASVVTEFGPPDIILDDGSHLMSHIRTSFDALYPVMSADGVYAVEDLHTAYRVDHEGGLKAAGSFIEASKDWIDDINAAKSRGVVPVTDMTKSTSSIHFYESMVVFERSAEKKSRHVVSGTPVSDERLPFSL